MSLTPASHRPASPSVSSDFMGGHHVPLRARLPHRGAWRNALRRTHHPHGGRQGARRICTSPSWFLSSSCAPSQGRADHRRDLRPPPPSSLPRWASSPASTPRASRAWSAASRPTPPIATCVFASTASSSRARAPAPRSSSPSSSPSSSRGASSRHQVRPRDACAGQVGWHGPPGRLAAAGRGSSTAINRAAEQHSRSRTSAGRPMPRRHPGRRSSAAARKPAPGSSA